MKKVMIIFTVTVLVVLFLAFIIYGYLAYTGYIMFEDLSRSEEIEKIPQVMNNQSEFSFSDIIEEDWDIAIDATNKNEEFIVEKYKEKGIINKNIFYAGLDNSMQQLNIILFLKDGEIVNEIIYDSRYYKFICKEEEIFYKTDCNFKIEKKLKRTIFKQI